MQLDAASSERTAAVSRLDLARTALYLLRRSEETFGEDFTTRLAIELAAILLNPEHREAAAAWLGQAADDIEHGQPSLAS